MIQIHAHDFWVRYRDEVRRQGTLDSLSSWKSWTPIAVNAAKRVCLDLGLRIGNELYLDVMGYEQRVPGMDFNWDLRVAFEHENRPKLWSDELCKLCHIAADLRVLVGYFSVQERIRQSLQSRVDLMSERMIRVTKAEWLFIFGPENSRRDPTPWCAFTLKSHCQLVDLPDDHPLIPYREFGRRITPARGD